MSECAKCGAPEPCEYHSRERPGEDVGKGPPHQWRVELLFRKDTCGLFGTRIACACGKELAGSRMAIARSEHVSADGWPAIVELVDSPTEPCGG